MGFGIKSHTSLCGSSNLLILSALVRLSATDNLVIIWCAATPLLTSQLLPHLSEGFWIWSIARSWKPPTESKTKGVKSTFTSWHLSLYFLIFWFARVSKFDLDELEELPKPFTWKFETQLTLLCVWISEAIYIIIYSSPFLRWFQANYITFSSLTMSKTKLWTVYKLVVLFLFHVGREWSWTEKSY